MSNSKPAEALMRLTVYLLSTNTRRKELQVANIHIFLLDPPRPVKLHSSVCNIDGLLIRSFKPQALLMMTSLGLFSYRILYNCLADIINLTGTERGGKTSSKGYGQTGTRD